MWPMQRTLKGLHFAPVMISWIRGTLHQTCPGCHCATRRLSLQSFGCRFPGLMGRDAVQARPGVSIRGDTLTGQKLGECLFGSGPVHHFRGVAVLRGPARGKVLPLLFKQ
jgi:hypothetical protein